MADSPIHFEHRIGRLSRAIGLRGELQLQLFRPRPQGYDSDNLVWKKLKPPLPVELDGEAVRYESGASSDALLEDDQRGRFIQTDHRFEQLSITHVRWLGPQNVAVRFAEVQDRQGAERRIGKYLDVSKDSFQPRLFDEVDRCFGLKVRHVDTKALLGTVCAIRDNGAQALLEIELEEAMPTATGIVDPLQEPGELEDEPTRTALVPFVPEFVVRIEEATVWLRPIEGLLGDL